MVTFTRAATSELRERVRARLLEAESALAEAAAGIAARDDEVLALLAAGTPDELAVRRDRIRRALADFDAATIATTHGFCQQVLEGLGHRGRQRPRRRLRRGHRRPRSGRSWTTSTSAASTRCPGARSAEGRPRDRPGGRPERPRAARAPRRAARLGRRGCGSALARAVRSELERRKRRMRIVTYDDFLTLLRATLADPDHGEDACERIRARYRVALIDEFQDTDPVQWEIVRRAFSPATLVLIGDPKQAIYSFRGADVHTYLRAAAEATARATLSTNWRSDQALIDAYDALFRRARLGHAEIPYRTVKAAAAVAARRLSGSPDDAPLRVRIVRRDAGLVALTPRRLREGGLDPARTWPRPRGRRRAPAVLSGRDRGRRPPGRGAARAPRRARAHQSPGLPGSRRPRRGRRLRGHQRRRKRLRHPRRRRVAAPAEGHRAPVLGEPRRARRRSPGSSAGPRSRLAEVGDADLEELHAHLHRLGGVLRRRGVAALLETVAAGTGLAARVLAERDGERTMTDLRHVGQLLHEAATRGPARRLGPGRLALGADRPGR